MGLKRNELIMVGVLLSGTLLAVLNMTFLSPALPTIMADLNVSQTTVQWLTSGYSLTEAVIIPLSAFLMSRFSTRKMFIGGIALFAAGSLLAALAPSFPFLLAGRVMQAACTGMVMPMVFTVILLIVPRENRGSAMGIIGLVIGFAPAIGPSLSGVLVDTVGWRVLFGIVTAISLAVIVLAWVVLKNFGKFEPVKLDPLSPVLSTAGLLCLLYGLSSFSSTDNMPLTVGLILAGVAIMAVFVRRQLKLEEPMLRVDILKTRRYATAVLVILIVQMALVGNEVVTPLLVQGVRGFGATTSGLLMLPGAVLGALVGFFAGKLFDRFGVRKLVIPGGILMCIGALGMASLSIDSSVVMIGACFTVLIVGLQFIMTPLNTWGVNSLDNRVIQHAQGVGNTINQVAGSFGTAVLVSLTALGWVIAPQGASSSEVMFAGIHLSYCVTAGLLIVAFVVVLLFVRDGKKQAQAGAAEAQAADVLAVPEGFGTQTMAHVGSVCDSFGEVFARPAEKGGVWSVGDAMNRDPHYVHRDATMADAVRLMAATESSGIPVVDSDLRVVGYISDGDVAKYLARNDASVLDRAHNVYQVAGDPEVRELLETFLTLNVMNIATKHVVCIDASDDFDVACRLMSERHIKKAPIVSDGRLVGTFSRRNMMHFLSVALESK